MLSNGEDRGQGTPFSDLHGCREGTFSRPAALIEARGKPFHGHDLSFLVLCFCWRCRIENKKQFFENARLYERKTFLLLIEKYLNWRPPTLYFLAKRARFPMVSGHRSKIFDPMASLSQSFLVLWALRWCLGLPLTPSGWMS